MEAYPAIRNVRAERGAGARLDAGYAWAQVVARPRLTLRPSLHEGVAVDSVRLCRLDAGPAQGKELSNAWNSTPSRQSARAFACLQRRAGKEVPQLLPLIPHCS